MQTILEKMQALVDEGGGEEADMALVIIESYAEGKITYEEAERQLSAACKDDPFLYFYERELMSCKSLREEA